MNDPHDAFREEAYELLAELETALMELEENPDDADLIDRVFRAMHTIKGSGAMFGFNDIAAFTHELETIFDLVREGRMAVSARLVNLSLSARDLIKAMLDASMGAEPADEQSCRAIIEELKSIVPEDVRTADPMPSGKGQTPSQGHASGARSNPAQPPGQTDQMEHDEDPDDDSSTEAIYRVRFQPGPNLFKTGTNPLLLLDELRGMGTCTVIARTGAIPALDEIDPEACYTGWDIVLTTAQDINAIRDVFIFVEDDCRIDIQLIERATSMSLETEAKKIGQILIERGDVSAEDFERALREQPRIGQLLVDRKIVDKNVVQTALAEQAHVKNTRRQIQDNVKAASVRVASEKLDMLVDLVGELVTVQARLSQKAEAAKDADLSNIAEVVERLTAELRDNTMNIRMMPFGTTFSKFKRLVRDISNELGKQVALTTAGGETELDKTVLEQLNDPLIHILRNSIDHGIETPVVREAAGKSSQGRVHLSAEHSGAHVLIRISDDGAGLNVAAIRARALEKGLIQAETGKTDRDIVNLIFAPGFSTSAQVTSVSGRGVGMDVVKRGIEALRGSIDIDSSPGKGTVITLKLPLTLAIIDGLLVETNADKYVLPLAVIEECVELTREDMQRTHGRNILNIRGEMVPFVSLRDKFAINGNRPDIEQVVVNEANGQRIGIVVDRVIGQHQIVIKTMSAIYSDVSEISGATILGDGTIALILDIVKLIETGSETKQAA
jgi:two-component system, chemotaxis family, sensor kinase CheA